VNDSLCLGSVWKESSHTHQQKTSAKQEVVKSYIRSKSRSLGRLPDPNVPIRSGRSGLDTYVKIHVGPETHGLGLPHMYRHIADGDQTSGLFWRGRKMDF
jgi:hypothetical protein